MYLCPRCRGFLCEFCDRQGTVQMDLIDLLQVEVAYPFVPHIRLSKGAIVRPLPWKLDT